MKAEKKKIIFELLEQANELIDLGNSTEKAEGKGILKALEIFYSKEVILNITKEFTKDLFNNIDLLPQEVQDVLKKYENQDNEYKTLFHMLVELNAFGYTFDYDLNAEPYNLRKL